MGKINKNKLARAMQEDMDRFFAREDRRTMYIYSQLGVIDDDAHAKLRIELAQEGLDDIKEIREKWKIGKQFLFNEASKNQAVFIMASLVIVPTIAFTFLAFGKTNIGFLLLLSLILVIPKGNLTVDTFDLLLWNLYRKD